MKITTEEIISNWNAIAALMDPEIREDIHNEGECDGDPLKFYEMYCERHLEKYGEKFNWI